MGVEKSGANRISKTGSIDLYRPPALRKIEALNEKNEKHTLKRAKDNCETINNTEEKNHRIVTTIAAAKTSTTVTEDNGSSIQSCSSVVNRPIRKERRPDRAVYVPRARRALEDSLQINGITNHIKESVTNNISSLSNSTDNRSNDKSNNISSSGYTRKTCKSTIKSPLSNLNTADISNDTTIKEDSRKSLNQSSVISYNCCDKPEPRPILSSSMTTTTSSNTYNCISSSQELNSPFLYPDISKDSEELFKIDSDSNSNTNKDCDNFTTILTDNNSIDTVDSSNIQSNNINNMFSKNNIEKQQKYNMVLENTALRIEDAIINNRKNDDKEEEDNEVQELQRASKEINRSNRCIMKQTFNSDVLEIPEANEITTLPVQKSELQDNDDTDEDYNNKEKLPQNDVDPENDDWDSLFDDNGECINPKILSELTASVGKVKIETPKTDYKAYHIKQSILNDEEFPHVLEVSNFPVEFKTQDLMMIFSTYKESGFDIKWVDDTHALAIFSSSRIAAEVLAAGHPFVLLKPLAEATIESRAKAKKCSASLQPYRPRPETCAALARRLVTGALGVRLKTAAEERENEKRVLKQAKERKLLAAKQRDEVWES